MNKQIHITIGISAYNEASNIRRLLESLLEQKIDTAKITKIYVVSDGSSDETAGEIRKVKDSRIMLIENSVRNGKTININKIFQLANDELLLILDADILLPNSDFIQEIVTEYQKDTRVGLIGIEVKPLEAKTYFENIIEKSHQFKSGMYQESNKHDSIYLCHGRARAFTKQFYKKLAIPSDVPEDAYTYLQCKELGFQFRSAQRAHVFFRSPANFSDHIKQSVRYFAGKEALIKYFSNKVINNAYRIKKSVVLKTYVRFLSKYPIEIVMYFFIVFFIKTFINKKDIDQSLWMISTTSKILKLI